MPRPPAEKGTLCDGDTVGAKPVTYGDVAGCHDVSPTLDCEALGEQRRAVATVRWDIRPSAEDGVVVVMFARCEFAMKETHLYERADSGRAAPA